MTTKHTPGPWNVCPCACGWILVGDCGRDVVTDAFDCSVEDANLISAAPELLEACELVEQAFVGDDVEMSTAVDAVMRAIAKAKGE